MQDFGLSGASFVPSLPMPPALFIPFRALGYITDDVPFAVQRRGRESFVTVSVGKSWQVLNASTDHSILWRVMRASSNLYLCHTGIQLLEVSLGLGGASGKFGWSR